MSNYRRLYLPGSTGFFTLTLQDRKSALLTEHIDLLREAFRATMARHPFSIDAIVILPEHLHALIRLPEGDADYSMRWRLVKRWFSHHLPAHAKQRRHRSGDEFAVWQRRFWAHVIVDERDYRAHVDYIHINPVKHGLVTRVVDWPHSSFHQYVARGILPSSWGKEVPDLAAGER